MHVDTKIKQPPIIHPDHYGDIGEEKIKSQLPRSNDAYCLKNAHPLTSKPLIDRNPREQKAETKLGVASPSSSKLDVGNLAAHVKEVYKSDRMIVRMLYPGYLPNKFYPLEADLSELIKVGSRRSSSSTWIPYKIPIFPFSDIGYILDSGECAVKAIFDSDSGVSRVDTSGKRLRWDMEKETYFSYDFLDPSKREYDTVDASTVSFSSGFQQEKNFSALKEKMILERKDRALSHNEVIVDYGKDKIIGIIVALNNNATEKYITDEEVIVASELFFERCHKALGRELPIFTYNCENGELVRLNA